MPQLSWPSLVRSGMGLVACWHGGCITVIPHLLAYIYAPTVSYLTLRYMEPFPVSPVIAGMKPNIGHVFAAAALLDSFDRARLAGAYDELDYYHDAYLAIAFECGWSMSVDERAIALDNKRRFSRPALRLVP